MSDFTAKLVSRTQTALARENLWTTLFGIFWMGYFITIWSKMLWIDEEGNLWTGLVNIWGDWAAHFSMQSAFAFRSLTDFSSPFLYGQTLSYPFVANFLSGLVVRLGVPWHVAPILLSAFFSLATVWALWWFFTTILRSKNVAVLASTLFLLNGGLGFVNFFSGTLAAADPLSFILNPQVSYTNIEPQMIRWINVIDSMIIPQRAFTLGFPVALMLLTLVWKTFLREGSRKKKTVHTLPIKKIVIIGFALGLLPILHTHSFLAVFVILCCWSVGDLIRVVLERDSAWRAQLLQQATGWALLATSAAAVALPLASFFILQNAGDHFISWFPGWYAAEGKIGWLAFWMLNWGVVPFFAVLSLCKQLSNKKEVAEKWSLLSQYLPFLLLFLLLNLFLFQPFIWDNTKLLVWASVGFSALAASGLQILWRSRSYVPLQKIVALVLSVSMVFSGALDVFRLQRVELHSYQMYSAEDLALAEWVRAETPAESTWLTSDQHNHWLINLTGRQPLMAFRGWLWTHGYNYSQVERDVMQMLGNPSANAALFAQYDIDYITIGPSEIHDWAADPQVFDALFPVVLETENYSIYQVK